MFSSQTASGPLTSRGPVPSPAAPGTACLRPAGKTEGSVPPDPAQAAELGLPHQADLVLETGLIAVPAAQAVGKMRDMQTQSGVPGLTQSASWMLALRDAVPIS